jgi:Divergent InlB B-repeat domain/PASTA domain
LKMKSPSLFARTRPMIVMGVLALLLAVGAIIGLARGSSTKPALAGPRLAAAGIGASSSLRSSGPTKVGHGVFVGHSYKNDVSRPLRLTLPVTTTRNAIELQPNPRPGVTAHRDAPDGARQTKVFPSRMPSPLLNFAGIPYPGVNCSCFPPDTNGEVGATQYVQIVNQGFQVFNKTTGASLLGPFDIATLWSGFGGVCQNNTDGDPVVIYDQLANRWVISQFAGVSVPTDECIAVSTSSDATATWYRYGYHLGSNFFDYPKLGVWPDAYYMSMNVFNSSATAYLGPQAFAFNRGSMLAGTAGTFITKGITGGPSEDPYLPADLDGSTPPPAGAPSPFVEWPGSGGYKVYRFHVDWATPANSTFTLAGTPTAAPFTVLCPGGDPNCVPQLGTTSGLDALADRLMFRAAYRNFGTHESLVANYTVDSNGVAGIRWFELRNLTSGTPTLAQESTYQPDSTWRWMGSAAMDGAGDLALGFSASSASMYPAIRYAGRVSTDPLNTLAQGETTLFAGTGSQTNAMDFRWGDYSDMTVDPVDDCTFWYTQEYYATTTNVDWQTRIGAFKLPNCPAQIVTVSKAGGGSGSVTSSPAGINCGSACIYNFGHGSSVTLTAAADSGSVFAGWSGGGCSGTGSCTVTLNADTTVMANFALLRTFTVIKTGSGAGKVTSSPAGITCGATCTTHFADGTSVTLTATAATGSKFTGWSGDCSGTGTCALTMSANHSVTAAFAKVPKCVVPKLVGLKLKKARAKLAKAHCRLGKVTKKASSLKKKGRVLSQKPKPRRQLANGAKVNVTIGKGPKK